MLEYEDEDERDVPDGNQDTDFERQARDLWALESGSSMLLARGVVSDGDALVGMND